MPDTDDIQPDPPPPEPEEPYPDPPPPGSMPPANEPGLPATMPFGGEIGELFGGCSAAQSVFSLSTALRDGVMTSGMAMLGESGSQAQVGTQLVTSRGVVKADLISQGMLQLGFMGFQPLPLINCTSQLLFSPSGFLGGQLQSMLFLPIGMMVGSINTSTQWSLEMVTGAQPSESLGIMLGCHLWGDRMTAGGMRPAAARSNPGAIFGYKACLEITKHVIEDEESVASTAVTLACTSPKVDAEGVRLASPDPTLSLSIFNRLNPKASLACSIERTPKSIHLTAGGSREVAPGAKLRGKWGTTGILAMALELSGDKSQLTFATEVNSIGPLNPKFGLNLNLSLDATGGSGPQSELDKQAELAGRLE